MNAHHSTLVSVGIPVYNGEAYLKRAIESVLRQTHRHLELIVVDNASTDGSPEIARAAARADCRVRVVTQTHNVGAIANFNRALEVARGEYFCWLAHDDWVDDRYLELCLAQFSARRGLVLCAARMAVVDASGRVFREQDEVLAGLTHPRPLRRFHRMLWDLQDPTAPVFGLARTSALRAVGGLPAVPGPDRHLLYALSLRGQLCTVEERAFFHFGPPGHMEHYGTGPLHRRSFDWLFAPGDRRIKVSALRVLHAQLSMVRASDLSSVDRVAAYGDVLASLAIRRTRSKLRWMLIRSRRRRRARHAQDGAPRPLPDGGEARVA